MLNLHWLSCTLISFKNVEKLFISPIIQKAMECLLQVPQDVTSEDFLLRLVSDDNEDQDPRIVYFLKILGLFEQFQYPHLAVAIAKNAIRAAGEDNLHVVSRNRSHIQSLM